MLCRLLNFSFSALIFLTLIIPSMAGNGSEKLPSTPPPEDEPIVLNAVSEKYTFSSNLKTGYLEARLEKRLSFEFLKKQRTFGFPVFYDNYSTIESFKSQVKNGPRSKPSKLCGNLELDNIFYSDAQFCGYTFGPQTAGKEIDIFYEKLYYDTRFLTQVFFHETFPSAAKTMEFVIPNDIEIELKELNFEGFDIEKSERQDEKLNVTIVRYLIKKTKKLEDLGDRDLSLHTLPHLLVIPRKAGPQANLYSSLGNTADVYRWYASLTNDPSANDVELQRLATELTEGLATDEEKIKAIYYWVQDHIKYIAYEDGIAGYKPAMAADVLNKKFGDCKGMANLTKALLKKAGYDARLAWIGTQRIPYTYDTPSLAVDNHMICAVKLGEEDDFLFLDATQAFVGLTSYATALSEKQTLIENGNGYLIKEYPEVTAAANRKIIIDTLTIENKRLTGIGDALITGEYKQLYHLASSEIDKNYQEAFTELLIKENFNRHADFEVATVPDINRDSPFQFTYNYTNDDNFSSFGDEYYIDLNINKKFNNLEEDSTSLGYKHQFNMTDQYKTVLALPEGYQLNYKPEDINIDNEYFRIALNYSLQDQYLTLNKEIVIKQNLFLKEALASWNKAIKKLQQSYEDQIILRKD